MTLDGAITRFIDEIYGTVAPATVSWYRRSLQPLAEAYGNRPVEEVTAAELRAWRGLQLRRGLAPTTVAGYLRAARRLFNWLAEERVIGSSPMARVRFPKVPDQAPRHVSDTDLRALLAAAQTARDRALLLFLADTGARVGGLVSMTVDGLELRPDGGAALVVEKGGKRRFVYFGQLTAQALAAWLAERPSIYGPAVWIGRQGPLQRYGIYQVLRRLAQRAGVKGRFNPHAFRHRFARTWLQRGGNLAVLSQAMGHADQAITGRYYARWSADEIEEWHGRVSPAELRKET